MEPVDDDSSSEESDAQSKDSQVSPEVPKKKAKKVSCKNKGKQGKSPKYSKKNSPPKKVSMAAARVSPKKGPVNFDRKLSQSVMSQNYMMSQISPSKKSPTKSKKNRNYENSIRHSTAAYRNDDLIDVNDELQIFDRNF